MNLWNKNEEKSFFDYYRNDMEIRQLFNRTSDGRFLAYWPKNYTGKKTTLQARNSLIGVYTENYVAKLLKSVLGDEFEIVQQAQIPEIGISKRSPADIAVATSKKRILKPDDVKLICEVKMSLVWNWEYDPCTLEITEIGDYRTHQGKPSFTRSDSILKAIGKCIDIRVSSAKASGIPLIVFGNAPLSNGFCKKADYLKSAGIIQGFWSLNPFPLNHGNSRKTTPNKGFMRFDNASQLNTSLNKLFNQELNFFSGMENPSDLRKLIETANLEDNCEDKGLKFLNLLRGIK